MIGIEAFLEVLAAAGVKYLFGNPGTTELPLNDALVPRLALAVHPGLQEVPVVAMADGYAHGFRQARRRVRAHFLRARQCPGHALQRALRGNAAAGDSPDSRTAGCGSPSRCWSATRSVSPAPGPSGLRSDRAEDIPQAVRRGPGGADAAHRAGVPVAAGRCPDGNDRAAGPVAAMRTGSRACARPSRSLRQAADLLARGQTPRDPGRQPRHRERRRWGTRRAWPTSGRTCSDGMRHVARPAADARPIIRSTRAPCRYWTPDVPRRGRIRRAPSLGMNLLRLYILPRAGLSDPGPLSG